MSRAPNLSDFNVPVEGVGQFTFARRQMADEIAIQVEFARMIDGVEPTSWLQAVCGWLSALKVLTVRAPEGWVLEELDPLDEDVYARLNKVYTELVDKERSFRRGRSVDSQVPGS
jgi:hypothetical protein